MCPHPPAALRYPRAASKGRGEVSGLAEPTPRQRHLLGPCLGPGGPQGPASHTTCSYKAQSTKPPPSVTSSFARAVASCSFARHRAKHSPKPWGYHVWVCRDQSILAGWICSHQPHNHPRLYPLNNYWLLKVVRNIWRAH